MAVIKFFGQDEVEATNLGGSGIGFYGNGFGASVEVGEYQDGTFITSSDGTAQGPQINNNKYTHDNSGSINGLTGINLLNFPNYLSTLNIRFEHGTPIKVQNAKFRVFDRVNINNNPSGVLCKVAEVIHPSETQTGLTGSGDSQWVTVQGSGSVLDLTDSPGTSGLSPSGANTEDTRHDFYLAISASPNSVGSKSFAGSFSCEYL